MRTGKTRSATTGDRAATNGQDGSLATLQARLAEYRDLLERTDQGYCVFEMLYDATGRACDYRFIETNAAFERHSGLKNAVGKTALELVPNLEAYWIEMYASVAETGHTAQFEQASEAMGRWFEVEAARVGGEDSHRVALFFHDITEQKRAEEALRTTQHMAELQSRSFDATLSAVPDFLFAFSPDARFVYANQTLLDLWRTTAQEAIGKTMAELNYPKETEKLVLQDLQRVLDTGQLVTNQTPYTNPFGQLGYFEYTLAPVFDAQGKIRQVVGSARDVTARTYVEQELRRANERFRIAQSVSNSFVYDWDVVTGVEARTDNFTNVLGYALDEAPSGGEAWESLMHPDDVAHVHAITETAANSGAPGARIEYRLRHKDGHWLWVLDEFAIMRDDNGQVVHVVGSIVDMTARKLAEERLRHLQHVTARLAASQSLAQLRHVLLGEVIHILGADGGGLRLFSDDGFLLDEYAQDGHVSIETIRKYISISPDIRHPSKDVAQSGEALFIGTRDEIVERYPDLAETVDKENIQATMQLPLKRMGEVFGVLSLTFTTPHTWDDDERNFAVALAERASVSHERVRLLEVSRESEARFRQLADAMPQIVWSMDPSAQINYLNQRWFEYTGQPHEETFANLVNVLHPDDYTPLVTLWRANTAAGLPFECEIRLLGRDGRYRWFIARTTPAHDADGHIIAWYGTSTDIDERKQAEMSAQFLAELGALTNTTADPGELMWRVEQATAKYFGVARAGFNEVDAGRETVVFHRDFADSLPSIAGTYAFAQLGSALIEAMRAGETMIVTDTENDPRIANAKPAYDQTQIRAFVSVPLMRGGEWVASIWIGSTQPRTWEPREVTLLATIAERAWFAVESARVQADTARLNQTLEARVAERTAELRNSQAQLRKLSAYAERTREDERTRIAREVHDQLGGSLTALKMSLARMRKGREADDRLNSEVADLRNQIDNLVTQVRRIASDLRPPLLDDFGLVAALEWQAREWEKHTGIACNLVVPKDEVHLDRDQRTAVFRVFQESLTNVARHSQAAEVEAGLAIDGQVLVLTVHDNGRGISADRLDLSKSMGLMGMRERMREVAGDFNISSAPGEGTLVTVRVPLG